MYLVTLYFWYNFTTNWTKVTQRRWITYQLSDRHLSQVTQAQVHLITADFILQVQHFAGFTHSALSGKLQWSLRGNVTPNVRVCVADTRQHSSRVTLDVIYSAVIKTAIKQNDGVRNFKKEFCFANLQRENERGKRNKSVCRQNKLPQWKSTSLIELQRPGSDRAQGCFF